MNLFSKANPFDDLARPLDAPGKIDGVDIPITLHSELTLEQFRGIYAVSPSRLKYIRHDTGGSPLHYQSNLFAPFSPSDDMKFGKMYDVFLLGTKAEFAKYTTTEKVIPFDDRPEKIKLTPTGSPALKGGQEQIMGLTSKENKLWAAERLAEAEADGMTVVPEEWFERCDLMKEALYRYLPGAFQLATMPGQMHYKAAFIDDQSGVLLKCEYDKRIESEGIILELKTAKSASQYVKKFPAQAHDLGYFSQAAIMADADLVCSTVVWIVQEKVAPFAPNWFHSDGRTFEHGRNNEWAGYRPLCKRIRTLRNNYGSEWDRAAFESGKTWPPFSDLSPSFSSEFVLHPPYWAK